MKMQTRDMILVALFAALTAIGAFIKIYNPLNPLVPITLQFLFCAYAGILLGSKYGLYSQCLYVGIGLIGIPVFTGGGGYDYVLKPTFGYLLGFILCATVIGKLTENMKEVTFIKLFVSILAGLAVVHIIGVPYLYAIVKYYLGNGAFTLKTALVVYCIPYIAKDVALSALIALTGMRVIPILRRAGYIASRSNI